MNVMNVVNMWKSAMFMPYPFEMKGRLNVMNVAQRFFARGACLLPNRRDESSPVSSQSGAMVNSWARYDSFAEKHL
jgi:hypothetical protein